MLSFGRRRLKPGWVALTPSGALLHAAHLLQPDGARPALQWVHSVPWLDPLRSLRGLQQRRALKPHRNVMLLQRHQYQVTPLPAPEVPRAQWRDAVRWQLKDMVDFAVDTANVELLEVPVDATPGRRPSLIAVASPRPELSRLVHVADGAGVPLQAIDVAETALRNVSALLEEGGRAQALLHVGDEHATLVVTAGGQLLMARTIELKLDALSHPDAEARRAAFERAGLELQRTLDTFERQFNQVALARLLVAPGGLAAPFIEYAADLVYVPVQPLRLDAAIDLSREPALTDPDLQGRYLQAIGAALRPH